MATVKKVSNMAKKENTPEVEVKNEKIEAPEVKETPDVKVNVPEAKDEPKVEVDTNTVDNSKIPTEKNVKIKMKENHRCWVGKELYELKKGQTYTVPAEIKMRLTAADVLMPL